MPESRASVPPDAEASPQAPANPSESGAVALGERVAVLLPLPLSGAYDYAVPAGADLVPGAFVVVPLGRRMVIGVVWGPGTGEVEAAKLREVEERLDVPPMTAALRAFIDWMARYTLAPPGAVLRMAMSVHSALLPQRPIRAYIAAEAPPTEVRLTPQRARVLDLLADGPPRTAGELAREAGCGTGVIKGMAEAGLLQPVTLQPRTSFPEPDWRRPGATLSPAQQAAADALRASVERGGYACTLLDGVTGAGKTEVYFEAIAAALQRGRQALVLLPEIALTRQWLQRFHDRFGAAPAEWHSDLSQVQRRQTWRAIAHGRAQVVVGARSALFLPFPDLGLIVVDEEHEPAFKQEEGVVYHARDMAVARAHGADFPIVLSSATPSLETLANVEAGRYSALHLPDRHAGADLPAIELIDMRAEPPDRQSWLSPPLLQALTETFAKQEQALLFLNRRGYAPLTLCRACGHRLECPHCTAWLVEHRLAHRLQCHHCGHSAALPETCPACNAEGRFAACGPGVERLAEEVALRFPDARLALLTSDTVHSPAAAAELFGQIEAQEIDVIIGTQIVAKGHHFPHLTLVGVVDADLGLRGGDLRAAERTFQLLQQVAGRAGRAEKSGRALVQTYEPEHPVMQALAANDRDRFLEQEKAEREALGMPPYGRLAALVVSGPYADRVDQVARALGRSAPRGDGITVLGPAPAPLAVLRGRHRRRLLVKCARGFSLQATLRRWLAPIELPAGVRLQVDVDPYSFL